MTSTVVITATGTVAASAVVNTLVYATLTQDPAVTAVTDLQIPSTQTWIIQDVYIVASADSATSNPVVTIYKDTNKIMGMTPPLSALLVTNNSRPRALPMPLGFGPVSTMRNLLTTTVANDATADSIKYYLTGPVIQA